MYSIRRGGLSALWLACLGWTPTPARAQDDRRDDIRFHISAGRLVDALAEVSRQARVQIVTSAGPELRTLRPLEGRFATEDAIRRITKDLPVSVRRMSGGYLVLPAPRPALARDLPPPLPQPAVASDARPRPPPPEPPSQPIVVTGFRESLHQAVALKRAASAIVEIARAEDIAAFPDHNAADALQRLPGIAISRDNGEGRQISLRGLGPLFTRTTLNGIEALATTASGMDNRGSASRQRRFDYSVFDAGLFSGVEARKTWSAQYDSGGIGGTVALKTLRPFDHPADVTLLSVQANAGANAGGVTPKITAEVSRRNDTLGVLVAASYSGNRVTEFGYRNWDWTPVTFGLGNVGTGVGDRDRARLTDSDASVYMARAQSYSTWANRFARLNMVGALQYEGNDDTRIALDFVHARLADHRREYSLAAAGTNGLTGSTIDGTQILNSVKIENDTIVAADFSGVDIRSESKVTEDHTDFNAAMLAVERPLGASTTLHARVGFVRSDFEEPVFDKVFLESKDRDFGYVATGSDPHNTYGFDIADPSNWSLMRADTREEAILNENATASLELVHTFSSHVELRFGASYRSFVNDGYERRVSVNYDDNAAQAVMGVIREPSMARYVVADVDATFAATGQRRALTSTENVPGTAYRMRERTYAAFALAQLDVAIGALPAQLEIGLRYVRTDTRSSGEVSDEETLVSVSQGSRHGAWLPSLQGWVDLRPDLRARLGFSRNVNQPDVADLRAAVSIDSTPFGGTIETGDPGLRPFTSTAFDLTFEHYAGAGGYASLGLFYKRLHSFITSATRVMTYAETGLPLSFLYEGQDSSALYNVIRPVNGSGASVGGAEAAFQHDLRFLPAPLDGLGMRGNVTFSAGDSDVIYDGEAVKLPLIDLSRWSGNATLYYTRRTWDARLSVAYRGTYRSGIGDNGNIGEWVAGSATVDFAAHALLNRRFQTAFEARNLTNPHIVQYADRDARRLLARTRSGRVFSISARYAF